MAYVGRFGTLEVAERSAENLLPILWVETENVANRVVYLASEKTRYVTGAQIYA